MRQSFLASTVLAGVIHFANLHGIGIQARRKHTHEASYRVREAVLGCAPRVNGSDRRLMGRGMQMPRLQSARRIQGRRPNEPVSSVVGT